MATRAARPLTSVLQLQLQRAGNLLYGERWQTDIARALRVDARRVRQWMASERPMPANLGADIAALLRLRRAAISKFLSEMAAHDDL
jgi:hypothetical protein